ncbi:MAG: CdaR family protein [Lachnospiraceae bacterium]|nr:CdaR family protein [Lachnospiraceae bacterium]
MKKKLTNNLSLKMISIISAFLVWLVVVNINDPITPRKISNVPVRFLNTDLVTGNDQVYTVLDETDVIPTVTITGQRSIVDSLDASDIIATADFADMTSSGTIAITMSSSRYNTRLESIKGSIDTVRLNVESVENIQLVIKAATTGTPAEGYMVGDITMEENLIRISGPQSVIDQIANALVTVDVSGATSDLTTNADIHLYNSDKIEISNSLLTRNIDAVKVRVGVLSTKTVPVNYSTMGTPAEGYIATGVIESTPDTVMIAGKTADLRNVSAITVPETELNVTGQSADMLALVDLKEYLPANIRFADSSFNGQANVVVYIEQEVTREFEIDESDIIIQNAPEGYSAVINDTDTMLNLEVSGTKTAIDALTQNSLAPTVDLSAYMEEHKLETLPVGHYTVPVSFTLTEDITIADPLTVRVDILQPEE